VTRPRPVRRLARAIGLAALVAAGASLAPRPAVASPGCPTPAAAGPQLAGVDPTRRLAFLEERLTYAEHKARLWTFGWGGGIAAAGIGSLVAVPFVAPENRVDWYTGAVSAGVGVAAIAIVPPVVLETAPALRADIASATLPADVCSLLATAESDLVRVARDEERQGAWYVHVGNVLFNVGLGLFLGLGFHHWEAGAINAAVGTAVGEALILTRPTAAIHDLDGYLAGAL
jgi:hypothetical protein